MVAAGAVLGAQGAVGDEIRFGAQAGVPSWSFDVGVPALNVSTSVEPDAEPSFGVAGQYIFHSGEEDDSDFYVGVEASYGAESASGMDRLTLLGTAVDVVAETAWVVDIAWLAGFRLSETSILGDVGELSIFGSVGASFAQAEVGVSLPDLGLTGSDEGKHFGWKAGAGIEFDIGRTATLQVRANYTYYEARTYRDQGVSLEVEPGSLELRATLLYRLDHCVLLGC